MPKYKLQIYSEYSWSFFKIFDFISIKKKSGKEIAIKLEECIKKFGIPEQIGSDNGSEFINKNVKNLLESNNIKFIHGKPYNPHSQGTVELVHRTVSDGLICKYLENTKKFNLNNSLIQVVVDTVINLHGNENYSILIEKDYDAYNLNKNDICIVNSSMMKKVDYKVWLKILNN